MTLFSFKYTFAVLVLMFDIECAFSLGVRIGLDMIHVYID